MGWVVNATSRPLYPRGRDPVPIVQEAGRSGRLRKISLPLRFDPRTVQPVGNRYADYAILAHLAVNKTCYYYFWSGYILVLQVLMLSTDVLV